MSTDFLDNLSSFIFLFSEKSPNEQKEPKLGAAENEKRGKQIAYLSVCSSLENNQDLTCLDDIYIYISIYLYIYIYIYIYIYMKNEGWRHLVVVKTPHCVIDTKYVLTGTESTFAILFLKIVL